MVDKEDDAVAMARLMPRNTGRRCFLKMASVGAGVVAAGLPLTSCNNGQERLRKDINVVLADHPKLAEIDQTVYIDTNQLSRPLAITRVSADTNDFIVTGTRCNHQGCGVLRNGAGFRCPCHGARFDIDGTLVQGPATADLAIYDFSVSGGVLTVRA